MLFQHLTNVKRTPVVRGRCTRPWGFTLIELLVVIAIISLVISIMLPSIQSAKELAREVICQSNARNIGTLLQYYAQDFDNRFPVSDNGPNPAQWRSPYRFWSVALAVYLTEDESLLAPNWYMISPNQPESVVKHFQCPTLVGVHPSERSTRSMNNYGNFFSDPDCFNAGLNLEAVEDPFRRVAVGEGAYSYSPEGKMYRETFRRVEEMGFYHNGGEVTGIWKFMSFPEQYEQTDGRGTFLLVDSHVVSVKREEIAATPESGSGSYFTTPY
ncbi:MAG: DUF1559 domain-containing protein [Phycisphaerae bacterium]|nr:DUF1559 domain-containing protein [Phycisphaerae bacterium]